MNTNTISKPRNSVSTIHPFLYNGQWVFDDESKGLDKEAFVAGADQIMDLLYLSTSDAEAAFIPDGAKFSIRFAASSFEGYQYRFDWEDSNDDDETPWNFYREVQHGIGGWLCPSLLDYFETPPKHIYVQAMPHQEGRIVSSQH